MSTTVDILVPDLGDFSDVPVVEILVKAGDAIRPEAPIVVLESDKATIEIPSTHAGVVDTIQVRVGDRVSQGSILLSLSAEPPKDGGSPAAEANQTTVASPVEPPDPPPSPRPTAADAHSTASDQHAQLLVLGAGPGGYTAAFRAADLGLSVVLVERYDAIGGVCLNVGCIPSKALLHIAGVIQENQSVAAAGLTFQPPQIDLSRLREWKSGVVKRLTGGLAGLAKKRSVAVVRGRGEFTSAHSIAVDCDGKKTVISFDQAIIAAGSRPVRPPAFPGDDPRVMDSTGALALADIPQKLLIVGGGIIGLEMATVYQALGSRISVVEMLPDLMAGADPDLVKPLRKQIDRQYEHIWTDTRVTAMQAQKNGIKVSFEGPQAPANMRFDRVLVAVGRAPNGLSIGAAAAGVNVTGHGLIEVDRQMRTNQPHIFAIGDIVGQPMLAHKAVHEGKVAAEVAAGLNSSFDAAVIPSVAYTHPEVAWVGVTETEAKAAALDYGKGVFPWAASGRSLSQGSGVGMTKLLFDRATDRLIGAGIVGSHAGDLIAEAALAIEMHADAQDIGLTIHPHPTLAETLGFAAEVFEGTITDLYLPKKGK